MDGIEYKLKNRIFRLPVLSLVLVLALALSVGMYLKWQHHMRVETLGVFDSRLQNLENTVLEQETRIKQLEAAAAKPAPITAAVAPASSPPPAPAAADQADRIAALEKDLAAFKAGSPLQDRDKLYHSIRLLSSFHRLSGKVLSGKPFATELSEFEDLVGQDAALDKPIAALSPYADSGVPGYAMLLTTFDTAMDGLKAEEAPPAGATLWQRIVFDFTHMVTIRRIDEAQKGNSVNAILGRAQAHLDAQEIPAAISEVASLPDEARTHFTSWLEDAQLATQAGDLVDQLEEGVMQRAFYTESAAGNGANDGAAPASQPSETAPKAE